MRSTQEILTDSKKIFMEVSKMSEAERNSQQFTDLKLRLDANNKELHEIATVMNLSAEPRIMRYKNSHA